MKKQLMAVSLLAGTAIGSGMISLPIVLANFGIVWSFALMVFLCWLSYASAMIRCDLNINSRADFSLKDVGIFFGDKVSGVIGDVALKVLAFALLSAYIFGGASVLRAFLNIDTESFACVAFVFVGVILFMFLFLSEAIIKINKHVFIVLFSTIMIGVIALAMCSKVDAIPSATEEICHLKAWSIVFPIVFTSFGFHTALHSLTKFADNNRALVRKACIFGSLVPAVVYTLWTICILVVIFNSDPEGFSKMLAKPIEVSELISILSAITKVDFVQHAVWGISFFAILTSIFGVGLALSELLSNDLKKRISNKKQLHITSTLVAIIPSAAVAVIVPNAFIRVLNFAGITFALMSTIIPVILYARMKKSKLECFETLKLFVVFVTGLVIILFGISDLMQ
ncbi:MAG: hypothetical protein LBG13_00120 [Holosporales bacterium]|jgi:tyrosine-specific transport protein|nr:hypothetical protein [Holosporales bacterium]